MYQNLILFFFVVLAFRWLLLNHTTVPPGYVVVYRPRRIGRWIPFLWKTWLNPDIPSVTRGRVSLLPLLWRFADNEDTPGRFLFLPVRFKHANSAIVTAQSSDPNVTADISFGFEWRITKMNEHDTQWPHKDIAPEDFPSSVFKWIKGNVVTWISKQDPANVSLESIEGYLSRLNSSNNDHPDSWAIQNCYVESLTVKRKFK